MPDLGGAESDYHGVWAEALTEPVVNEPGCYRTISVELELQFLAIAAIMESHLLDASVLVDDEVTTTGDGDGNGNGNGNGNNDTDANEHAVSGAGVVGGYDSACAPAFKLLKAMVTGWIDEILSTGSAHADVLLTSFYRYICGNGDALLHDPALHRVVFGLMTKLFKRMVAELRRLGLSVVHADFNRVTINTNKVDVDAAREHVDFILKALHNKPLFQWLKVPRKTPAATAPPHHHMVTWSHDHTHTPYLSLHM